MTGITANTGLSGNNPHDLDDRAAMGLPPRLVTRVRDRIGDRNPDIPGRSREELGDLAASSESWERRYLAGQLLALLGDPRIRPLDPELVSVPGGQCLRGTPSDEVDEVVRQWASRGVRRSWIEKECPRHVVDVASFRMMRYPVTNLEYRIFLEETGRWPAPTSWRFGAYPAEHANHPVWTVSEEDADLYAEWLSAKTGRLFRLPTEIEWEYAASGGSGRSYPWGEEFAEDAVNTVESGPLSTTPVGIYPDSRSPFGIDDLAGNVEEYVLDEYTPYPGGDRVNDDLISAEGSGYRIARGGSFTRFGDLTRCARRHGRYSRDFYAVGFRLVEDSSEA